MSGSTHHCAPRAQRAAGTGKYLWNECHLGHTSLGTLPILLLREMVGKHQLQNFSLSRIQQI